jgi:heterodisulfide reductase subunit A
MLEKRTRQHKERYRIAVIGAGPAGVASAVSAAALGMEVDWYEKESRPGGKLNDYHELFPDRVFAREVLAGYTGGTEAIEIKKHFGTAITRIETENEQFILLSDNKIVGSADAVIIATGFDFFNARKKEEFGYGIYDHVITSPDLEKILKTGPHVLRRDGRDPATVAFVHCVGSRDQQAGNNYCSRLCCMTGIKQAIEIRELFPDCRVVSFYIDIRTFGTGYEELYREAQEKHKVQFIRGRVSEASENQDHRIVLKAEDTLMAKPLKLTADWLVLLSGMVPSGTQVEVDDRSGTLQDSGFYRLSDTFTGTGLAERPGIFVAGACSGPMSIPEAGSAGRSAALETWKYLNNR